MNKDGTDLGGPSELNTIPQSTNTTTPEQEETALQQEGLPSGAEVASASPPQEREEEDDIAVGDHIRIEWRGGITEGMIYYVDETLLRILPDSASSVLVDFPLIDGLFDEELRVNMDTLEFVKGSRSSFVELNQFAPGQRVDAYAKDGTKVGDYTIVDVNLDDDRLRLRDESGTEFEPGISHHGFDLSEPFAILRVQPQHLPDTPATEEETNQETVASELSQIEGADNPLLAALAATGEEVEIKEIGEWETQIVERVETIPLKERVYSEIDQKSDMFSDLMSMLDQSSQQNPILRTRIRTIIEVFSSLKQGSLSYTYDGTYSGPAKITLSTLADALKDYDMTISRPVLDTNRIIVTEKGSADDSIDGIRIMTLDSLTGDSRNYLELQDTYPIQEEGVGLPRFYQTLQNYFNQYPMGDEYKLKPNSYKFITDSEYFRKAPPDVPNLPKIRGLKSGTGPDGKELDAAYKGQNPQDHIYDISMSLRRGHGPTYIPLPKGGTEEFKAADRAALNGYVLMPYSSIYTGTIGSLRTGQLWEDILRSQPVQKEWMATILEQLGGIQTEEDAKKPIYIPINESSTYTIPFSEYLKLILQSVILRGSGDMFAVKADLGIQEAEPNLEQQTVIQERITEVMGSLMKLTIELRKELANKKVEKTVNPILDLETGKRFTDAVFAFPYLSDILKKMSQRTPGYTSVDVAIMASLILYAQDFALAVLAGNKEITKRELLKANMETFLKTLADANAYKQLQESLGEPPHINPCEHVKVLDQIRRIQDDDTRMKALVKFLKLYRGGRADNWVLCNFCTKPMICQHEILQIQQFLNPAQHMILQKEIVLQYAGGTFGANHICKNCGIKIAELSFDTGLEYDDEGRPMMGRSVLVDTDAIAIEALDGLFDLSAKVEEEIKFGNQVKDDFFSILRTLCIRFGIEMDMKTMRKLVEKATPKLDLSISEKEYEAAREKGKPKYSIYKAYLKVGIMSALFLIEIQTRQPTYMPTLWIDGCKKGFGGYPLQPDSDPENPDQSVGLDYVVCGVVGIESNANPWNLLGTVRKLDERKVFLRYHIKTQILEELKNADIQSQLSKKREYLRELYGATSESGQYQEQIPSGFLPHIVSYRNGLKSATKEPVVQEGVRGTYGQTVLADAWIRAVNKLAAETTVYIENTPFIETGCCFSPIQTPGLYLREASLPTLPSRKSLPPGFSKQSILYVPYIPRPLIQFNVKPSLELTYRIFLEVCWHGPRVGLPHEFGYDHMCDWCNLKLPIEYRNPSKFDDEGAPILQEDAIRVDLDKQGIPLTEESFQELVNTINTRQIFLLYKKQTPFTGLEILQTIRDITPAPVLDTIRDGTEEEIEPEERWKTTIDTILRNISGLSKNVSEAEIADRLQPLRDSIADAEESLAPLLGIRLKNSTKTWKDLLLDILKEQPNTIYDIIRSYFIVPAQRICNHYTIKQLSVPNHYNLIEDHKKQINTLLEEHSYYLIEFNGFHQKGIRKLKYFVDSLSASLNAVDELRVSRLSGFQFSIQAKQQLVTELLRTILLGCLGQLATPLFYRLSFEEEEEGEEEEEEEEDESPENDDRLLQVFILKMIQKYYRERTVYNPEKIREELAKAKELENNEFVNIMDRIQDNDERRIEIAFKNLKIKSSRHNWNLGAGKLEYSEFWSENQGVLQRMDQLASEMGLEGGEGYGDEYGIEEGEDGYMGVGAFGDQDDNI